MRGLKYVSMHGPTGYGEAARRYVRGLAEAGVSLTWSPVVERRGPARGPARGLTARRPDDLDAVFGEFLGRRIEYDTVLLHTVPEYFPAWAEREPGKRIVGYTAWETDRPPAHWPALLNGLDLLLVPCEWNREVFRAHGITTRIEVVPHVAPSRVAPPERALEHLGLRAGDFCFYTIGEWNARKAVRSTVEAYLETFTADDPVALVVKTTPWDATRGRWLRRLLGTRWAVKRMTRSYAQPPRIVLVTDTLSDAEIVALHAAGDCYVSLTSGEGWGLGAFDAAAFGRPVIMTNFGGTRDWLTPNYPFAVNHRMVPVDVPRARKSYSADQRWAEADRGHAGRLMRQAHEARDAAAAAGRSLEAHVRARFSRAVVTERLLGALA